MEALLFGCSDLPENLILSHDAVEGAILRGGYMSDTELTDGFPSKPAAYFRRLHRWVRGDWQNLGFIFGRAGSSPLRTGGSSWTASAAACTRFLL